MALFSDASTATMGQPELSQSCASIDTVADLLQSLSGSKECDKRNITADDVLSILCKRMLRHGASSTALADSLNYLNHPYYAGAVILIMASVGMTDAAYKIGGNDRQNDACLSGMCKWIHKHLHHIQERLPDASTNAFKKLYYNCSLIAAASTVPADLLSHMEEAGFLQTDVIQPVICPLAIFLPTICTAILTCRELQPRDSESKTANSDTLQATKLIVQRIALHAASGTVSADIAVYLGHPEIGAAAILIMGSIGLVDGLIEYGELLTRDESDSTVFQPFRGFCKTMHHLFNRLSASIPAFLNELIGNAYLYSSVAGAAGTIVADVLAYLGSSSHVMQADICPLTVTLFASLGAIAVILPGVISRTVKSSGTKAHFLMTDNPVNIV